MQYVPAAAASARACDALQIVVDGGSQERVIGFHHCKIVLNYCNLRLRLRYITSDVRRGIAVHVLRIVCDSFRSFTIAVYSTTRRFVLTGDAFDAPPPWCFVSYALFGR